jgi:LCP family protein required for cell wall assembly
MTRIASILRRRPRLALGAALACAVILVGSVLPLAGGDRPAAAAAFAVGRVHKQFQPNDGKVFVLVIGSDARQGNPTAANGDAIHLLGINTRTMKGGILNFPRDCWVSIPGHGTGKINSSLARGGPELMVRTIESLTGMHIDYWLMTGFEGFQGAVHALGNLRMTIPTNVYDVGYSGANLKAGTYTLPAYKVLQYARARHPFPHGDLDRSRHQANILLALLAKLRSQVESNPGVLMKWIAVARKYTNENLSAEELFRLGILASQVRRKDVGNVNVPVGLGSVGAASVDFIQTGQARSIYRRFKEKGSL